MLLVFLVCSFLAVAVVYAISPVLAAIVWVLWLAFITYNVYYFNFTDEGQKLTAEREAEKKAEREYRKRRKERGYNSFTEWKRYKSAIKHGRSYRGWKDPLDR